MSVISNTTVLSNFAAIESIEMLHELYGELFVATGNRCLDRMVQAGSFSPLTDIAALLK